MARREITGRGPGFTADAIGRKGGSPDPEDDEEDDDPEDDDQPATDPIDQPDPDSDESDNDESDDNEPIKHGEPAAQALVTKPPIRGPPRRLTRKEKAQKAKVHPEKAVPEGDAYSIQEFCRRHRISIQLFYKYENDMPDTFNVGKRRLISREAAARWRAEREEAGAAKAVKAAAAIPDELCEGKTVRTTPEADAKWRAKREGAAVASGTAGPINSDTTA